MQPTIPLKYASIAFAVLWTGGMIWWSGIYHPANIIILSTGGAIAGYVWYHVMRRSFRRISLLPRDGADHGVKS